jgi:hypothetical protein
VDLEKIKWVTDREDIRECLTRYARGVDRHDAALIASVFHADAFQGGGVFEGTPAEFAAWANDLHAERWSSHQHYLTNVTIDVTGETAHTEAYYILVGLQENQDIEILVGRYIDRFAYRSGEWKIAHRSGGAMEAIGRIKHDEEREKQILPLFASGTWDETDLSYMRPLKTISNGRA